MATIIKTIDSEKLGLNENGDLCLRNATTGVPLVVASGTPIVDVTASTVTVAADTHSLTAGKIVTLNRAAGIAVTLPAASGTGIRFRFYVGTTVTSNSTTIKVANASDTMIGFATILQDGGDTAVHFEASGTDDTITLNGTTTGGIAGDYIEVVDIATNKWHVLATLSGTGTEADPFSATVS